VIGTSLFQIMFVTSATTLMHAISSKSVDAVLALLLLVGGVIGAQAGAMMAPRLRAEQMRLALALLVLAVCLQIAWGLLEHPAEVFNLVPRKLP
jgi:uncharacterized membrane protein YfcA